MATEKVGDEIEKAAVTGVVVGLAVFVALEAEVGGHELVCKNYKM
jgi:hypothetical protein